MSGFLRKEQSRLALYGGPDSVGFATETIGVGVSNVICGVSDGDIRRVSRIRAKERIATQHDPVTTLPRRVVAFHDTERLPGFTASVASVQVLLHNLGLSPSFNPI